jgi:hypothetical protein
VNKAMGKEVTVVINSRDIAELMRFCLKRAGGGGEAGIKQAVLLQTAAEIAFLLCCEFWPFTEDKEVVCQRERDMAKVKARELYEMFKDSGEGL